MKTIEIKITGSGTINQVGISLNDIVRLLLNNPEDVEDADSIVLEDEILHTEITVDYANSLQP